MIHALELPEAVLHELEATTVERRLSTIREFLQHRREQVAHQRRAFAEAVADLAQLRQEVFEQFGLHPDSSALIREDRDQ